MKKSAAAHLKMLSEMSADPTKTARLMLDTGKKYFKQTNKQISFITIGRLTRKQLGTEEVEVVTSVSCRSAPTRARAQEANSSALVPPAGVTVSGIRSISRCSGSTPAGLASSLMRTILMAWSQSVTLSAE